jgi:hypothetical protein
MYPQLPAAGTAPGRLLHALLGAGPAGGVYAAAHPVDTLPLLVTDDNSDDHNSAVQCFIKTGADDDDDDDDDDDHDHDALAIDWDAVDAVVLQAQRDREANWQSSSSSITAAATAGTLTGGACVSALDLLWRQRQLHAQPAQLAGGSIDRQQQHQQQQQQQQQPPCSATAADADADADDDDVLMVTYGLSQLDADDEPAHHLPAGGECVLTGSLPPGDGNRRSSNCCNQQVLLSGWESGNEAAPSQEHAAQVVIVAADTITQAPAIEEARNNTPARRHQQDELLRNLMSELVGGDGHQPQDSRLKMHRNHDHHHQQQQQQLLEVLFADVVVLEQQHYCSGGAGNDDNHDDKDASTSTPTLPLLAYHQAQQHHAALCQRFIDAALAAAAHDGSGGGGAIHGAGHHPHGRTAAWQLRRLMALVEQAIHRLIFGNSNSSSNTDERGSPAVCLVHVVRLVREVQRHAAMQPHDSGCSSSSSSISSSSDAQGIHHREVGREDAPQQPGVGVLGLRPQAAPPFAAEKVGVPPPPHVQQQHLFVALLNVAHQNNVRAAHVHVHMLQSGQQEAQQQEPPVRLLLQ